MQTSTLALSPEGEAACAPASRTDWLWNCPSPPGSPSLSLRHPLCSLAWPYLGETWPWLTVGLGGPGKACPTFLQKLPLVLVRRAEVWLGSCG